MMNLEEVASEIKRRLASIFLPGAGWRAALRRSRWAATPTIRSGATTLLFNEYFHGDNGRGLGANHQTGWTALIADCLRGCPPKKSS